MQKLTAEQKKAMLQLGNPESDFEWIQAETMQQLMDLGLVYKSGEKAIDFSDDGESVYGQLTGESVG